ncbi:MAG: response regulator, partial [bacterium]
MNKKTILLVADDYKVESSIKDALQREYKIERAETEKSAAAYLEKNTPDLIIIDFDLRTKDGLAVYKSINPPVNVVMISSSSSIPLAVSAAKLGVVDFLRKPLVAAELKKSISENIRGEKQQLAWSSGQRWLLGEGP